VGLSIRSRRNPLYCDQVSDRPIACLQVLPQAENRTLRRWSLILLFMVLKAGLIVAVFMHMAWERLALAYAILLPPVLVLVFVAIMVFESDYTHLLRVIFFAPTA
jgi:cytochrome c oxidase subunit IV